MRTPNGILLERMIGTMKDWRGHSLRYLFCFNGESPDDSYDCGCCLTWETLPDCHCPCHERIEKMAASGDLGLLFFALGHAGRLPKFASSWDELEAWRKDALVRGEHHYHNTTGKFSNYPRVVCSVCIPSDEHPKLKYDNYTGELLKTPGVANPYCHTCGSPYPVYRNPLMGEDAGKRCEDGFHPVVVAAPEFEETKVSGCFFHGSPEPRCKSILDVDTLGTQLLLQCELSENHTDRHFNGPHSWSDPTLKEWKPGGCVS